VSWIAFDDATAAGLEEKFGRQAQVSVMVPPVAAGNIALRAALIAEKPSVALLPAGSSDHVLLVSVRHINRESNMPGRDAGSEHISYQASGILGLSDEPVFEEECQPPKKWWQKILD
jgi:hypothetical protein